MARSRSPIRSRSDPLTRPPLTAYTLGGASCVAEYSDADDRYSNGAALCGATRVALMSLQMARHVIVRTSARGPLLPRSATAMPRLARCGKTRASLRKVDVGSIVSGRWPFICRPPVQVGRLLALGPRQIAAACATAKVHRNMLRLYSRFCRARACSQAIL